VVQIDSGTVESGNQYSVTEFAQHQTAHSNNASAVYDVTVLTLRPGVGLTGLFGSGWVRPRFVSVRYAL